MMDKRFFRPKTRFRMAVRRIIDEVDFNLVSKQNKKKFFLKRLIKN